MYMCQYVYLFMWEKVRDSASWVRERMSVYEASIYMNIYIHEYIYIYIYVREREM